MEINFIPLNHFKSQTIDGGVLISSNAQEIFKDFIAQKKIQLNLEGKYQTHPKIISII
jgi:hypothetical protein